MGFFREEYWSGMLFPSPGESSWPKNWTQSPELQADSLLSELPGKQHSLIYKGTECLFMLAISRQVLEWDRPGKYLELGMECAAVSGRRNKNGLEETTKTSEEHLI